MLLEQFNNAEPAELMMVLRPCVDIERWAQEIIGARPFASRDELLACARTVADPFTEEEVTSAMAHHPRIGERAAGGSTEAALSRQEQSGVDATDSETMSALTEANRTYEAKFDQVFLIRAAGRTPQEVIEALHQRLGHSADEEAIIVSQQLREIAVLRLKGVVSV